MSTALYRRYRPESFADVIGQEHVTEPLMAALSKNRVNHAYLFSGPRGCGKTTSARILARCLNCAQGPTPIPCGTCDSCVELARNGAGSLDVIEIDAASHGGVDDARDLRERATFAPVRDRYKIFIIDEAHMVTSAGFNALLKIVEEPPEHIKFIFATTEPDKVIGTIRSRTHHYPFRLVPPEPLLAYLEKLCVQENVPVAPGVLSLVIRAGGGSVRDSLSVLDQLMAGAGEAGLDYELAVNLLGYTHVALLDDVVDAFAAGDAATVFSAVDRVIQTGQDPRRFVEDLLERFRDLIVVSAMPDSAAAVLRGVPEDQINRMRTQASQFGGAELSRAADITNTALTEMTGATSPRLHLELLCARILLPAADKSERGTAARVDRIERRLSYAGDAAQAMPQDSSSQAGGRPAVRPVSGPTTAPAASPRTAAPQAAPETPETAAPAAVSAPSPVSAPASGGSADWGGTWATPAADSSVPPAGNGTSAASSAPAASGRTWDDVSREAASSQPVQQPAQGTRPDPADSPQAGQDAGRTPQSGTAAPQGQPSSAPAQQQAQQAEQVPPQGRPSGAPSAPTQQQAPAQQGAATAAPAAGGAGQVEMIRRAWPEIMDALTSIRRATWLNVSKNASPRAFDGRVLELAFSNPGAATNFNRPDHLENLRKAIHQVLGVDCQINAVHDSSAAAGEPGPKAGSRLTAPAQTPAPAPQVQATAQAAASVPQVQSQHASAPAAQAPAATAPAPTVPARVPARVPAAVPAAVPAEATAEATEPVRSQSMAAAQGQAQAHSGASAAVPAPATANSGSGSVQNAPAAAIPADSRAASTPASAPAPAPAEQQAPAAQASAPATATHAPAPQGQAPQAPAEQSPAQQSPDRPGPAHPQPAAQGLDDRRRPASGTTPPRRTAPLPDDWPQEPSEPADVPESNAWETAAVPDDIHVSSAVSDEEWASTNWAGTTSTRPGTARAASGQSVPAGRGPSAAEEGSPAAHGASAHQPGRNAALSIPAGTQHGSPPSTAPAHERPARGHNGQGAPSAQQPAPGQKLSRYQQLLHEAAQRNGTAPAAAARGNVDLGYVEDVPSADDVTLEDSGLVGRKAIERILGGRLIEERSLDGHGVHR